MSTRTDIAKQWIDAQQSRDADKLKLLGDHLKDDIVFSTPRGDINGKQAILDRLQNPPQGPGGGAMMGRISWGEPAEEGATVNIVAQLPEGLPIPIKGLDLSLEFNEQDKVTKAQITPQR